MSSHLTANVRPISVKMLRLLANKSPARVTPRELAALATCKEKVTIIFKSSDSEPAAILFPEYPLDLAKAFSVFAMTHIKAKKLPAVVAVPGAQPRGKCTLTITAGGGEPPKILKGDTSYVQHVFRWIKSYALGNETLPSLPGHQLFEHLRLLDVAEELEVPLLISALTLKINILCNDDLDFDDVEAVVTFYCRGEDKWEQVTEGCALAVARGAIDKADLKFKAIMEAHEAFGDALEERVLEIERARADLVKRQHRGNRRAKVIRRANA